MPNRLASGAEGVASPGDCASCEESSEDTGVPPTWVVPALSAPSFPRKHVLAEAGAEIHRWESIRPGNSASCEDADIPPARSHPD